MLRKFLFPLIAFEEDDGTGSGEPAAPAVPEPTAEAPAAPAPQPGPWASDLESYFEDPAVRAQADRFLREKIQPHVTQIEQQQSQYAPARELYDDLLASPEETLAAITTQLYGEDAAQALAQILQGEPANQPAEPDSEGDIPPQFKQFMERVQPLVERDEQERARAVYESELAKVKQEFPDLVEKEFHPFVVTAEGNMPAALEAYKVWRQEIAERYGQPAAPTPEAPPTIGTEGTAPVVPPTTEKFSSLDDAIDSAMDDIRASRAPSPVGTV